MAASLVRIPYQNLFQAVLNRGIGLLLTLVPRAKKWVPRFADPVTVNVS